MRSKRETNSGNSLEDIKDRRCGPKNKHHENLGETFVRSITGINASDNAATTPTQEKDPFSGSNMDANTTTEVYETQPTDKQCDNTSNNFVQMQIPPAKYTKFHLEDDEMLMELMMHLHSDCPDMMTNKQDLLHNVARLFDNITNKHKIS
jgi:hypothetical protein